MSKILVLHGPNLNMLGKREPEIYGHATLADIEQALTKNAAALNHDLASFQSNSEADLVDKIQQSHQQVDFIIINPAAFTHTSVAIRDALLTVQIPFIEVHLSNVYAREEFRQHSFLSDIALGVISGFGQHSYELALVAAHQHLTKE